MKPTIYGEMNLVFAYETDEKNEELALRHVECTLDENLIESVKVIVKNMLGEVIELNAMDWFVKLESEER